MCCALNTAQQNKRRRKRERKAMNPDVTYGCWYPCMMIPMLTLTCRQSLSILSVHTTIFHSNVHCSFYCSLSIIQHPQLHPYVHRCAYVWTPFVCGSVSGSWMEVYTKSFAFSAKNVELFFPSRLSNPWTSFDPWVWRCVPGHYSHNAHLSFVEFGGGYQKCPRHI